MAKKTRVLGTEELSQKFNALSVELQGETLITAMKAGGTIIVNAIKENIQKQGLFRTRNLSRSVHEEVTEQDSTRVVLEIGTDLEYAAIHEYGGIIKAKNGKYLAIPVGSYKDSPLKHPGLKVRKTGRGTLILVDGGGTAQYVLKTSVEIPAKPYMRPAFDENKDATLAEIGQILVKKIEEITQK